ncbi:hypothetical protein NC651_037296 [Populus alba x Populus x berolinensis]|nr:hypothetical protein NC651_037296 [Populus alba x Populus x berolinensis]
MPGIKEAQWNMKAFSKMSRLRLLKIDNVQFLEGPEDLSNKLRFLEWNSYPSKSLPTGLQVDVLVELHMANSSLEQLWYGCKIVGFMDEMRSDTVFPVSYDVEQSKIDDQKESCTIVFDKNEENLRENEEKVQRWIDILSEVEISSRLKRYVNKSVFFFFFFWHGKNTVQGSVHNGVTSFFFQGRL